jgi:O-methyltransferase domain
MPDDRDADWVWAHADLVTPMTLRVAATLRVADHLAGTSCTAEEVAAVEHVHADSLDRVLRHLTRLGVLRDDEHGRYALTTRGDPLRDEHPSGLRALLDIEGALGRAELSFVHLLHSVRTGDAAYPVLHGHEFWADMASAPARTATYDAQMARDVATWAPGIAAAVDWTSIGHVVDVGGGDGTLLTALLTANPSMHGTVVEQPATAETARQTLAAAGFAKRGQVVAGSFFDPLPSGADGYLLCAVLHNWDDDAARAILRRCRDAAGTSGRVFVVEKTGAGGEKPSTSMGLRVLAYFGGRERGVAELIALAASADLEVVTVHPAGDLTVIELTY